MVTGIVVPAEGDLPLEQRDFARLEDYQAAVDGWIETVDLPSIGVTIFINEEGLIRQLPFNSRASFPWWYHVPEARQKAMLVGDALLVGMPDRNPPLGRISAPASLRARRMAPYVTWRRSTSSAIVEPASYSRTNCLICALVGDCRRTTMLFSRSRLRTAFLETPCSSANALQSRRQRTGVESRRRLRLPGGVEGCECVGREQAHDQGYSLLERPTASVDRG